LLAVAALLNCTNTLLQEIHYIACWRKVMIGIYEASKVAYEHPQLSFGPVSIGFDAVLYWIIFYIYNVQGLLFLFW